MDEIQDEVQRATSIVYSCNLHGAGLELTTYGTADNSVGFRFKDEMAEPVYLGPNAVKSLAYALLGIIDD